MAHAIRHFVLAAAVSVVALSQASSVSAGCCGCNTPCWAPGRYIPVVHVPDVVTYYGPMYVVNQGPVYSGPGVVTYAGYFDDYRPMASYPYFVDDYYYPHYYGWYGFGRHPMKRVRLYK